MTPNLFNEQSGNSEQRLMKLCCKTVTKKIKNQMLNENIPLKVMLQLNVFLWP